MNPNRYNQFVDRLILIACQTIWVILCLEVRELHSLCSYLHFLCSYLGVFFVEVSIEYEYF